MSQDYDTISPTDVLTDVRQKILNRDEAVRSLFLGTTEPSVMEAGQPWIDTTANVIKIRNSTNLAWITIGAYNTQFSDLPLAGGTMADKITLDGVPSDPLHCVTKSYMDTFLLLTGGTLAGVLNMDTAYKITNVGTPTDSGDLANKAYADSGKPINSGKAWISHGDNVITLAVAQSDANYIVLASLVNAPMGGITTRGNGHSFTAGQAGSPLELLTTNESTTRLKVRINGGYGFTSGGYVPPNAVGTTERFDDVANTHTARTALTTVRRYLSEYSLNGYGFTTCGYIAAVSAVTERFDDVANTHTARTDATARYTPAGYSLNNYGFTSCGFIAAVSGVTERFDDTANTHTARTGATARRFTNGYALNNYGFTSGGLIASPTGITERFDDVANTHTARTALTTVRQSMGEYSTGGYGFTSCGYNAGYLGTTERFDDTANTHTARTGATARAGTACYSLNGCGFTSCGDTGVASGVTERFDDTANTQTARTNTTTSRNDLSGYATNEYFINYVTFNNG